MSKDRIDWYIGLYIDSPDQLSAWLQNYLFFQKVQNREYTLKNGNCLLKLHKGRRKLTRRYGFCHIALAVGDAAAAVQYCKSKELIIESDGKKPFHNPNVWGSGTKFINIKGNQEVPLELCQRLDCKWENVSNIYGLEHLGIHVEDMESATAFFKAKGFSVTYPEVTVSSADSPKVTCSMMSNAGMMLELFTVEDAFGESGIKCGCIGYIHDGRGNYIYNQFT
ncbi:MAG: hypothetical protein ACLRTG_05305 [Enterocloster aldenensis]